MTPLQIAGFALERALARFLAFGATSFTVAALAALAYRWYARSRLPTGLAVLLGTATVAIYLNTVGLFGAIVGGAPAGDLFEIEVVLFNVLSLALAAAVAPVGREAGDRFATSFTAVAGARELEGEMSRVVRSVGRIITVELPEAEDIDDIEGYDPVPAERKAELGGKTLLFPRRLTVSELRDRLVTRLKDDYAVGHVDIELDEDGTVTYLALGSRVAGLGPTLGPGAAAVAVRADPANTASSGDVVQVWRTDPDERVLTGELRAVADDVVTLVADESEVTRLDPETEYRLVTLPTEPRADREFTSLLRAADETMAAVTVSEESDLAGSTVGDLDVTVAALRSGAGPIEAVPSRASTLAAGDTLYVVARPEALRRLEGRAEGGTQSS